MVAKKDLTNNILSYSFAYKIKHSYFYYRTQEPFKTIQSIVNFKLQIIGFPNIIKTFSTYQTASAPIISCFSTINSFP